MTSLYQNVIITVAFDTTVNVSVGTEELCTIEEPPKREKEVGKKTFHFKIQLHSDKNLHLHIVLYYKNVCILCTYVCCILCTYVCK